MYRVRKKKWNTSSHLIFSRDTHQKCTDVNVCLPKLIKPSHYKVIAVVKRIVWIFQRGVFWKKKKRWTNILPDADGSLNQVGKLKARPGEDKTKEGGWHPKTTAISKVVQVSLSDIYYFCIHCCFSITFLFDFLKKKSQSCRKIPRLCQKCYNYLLLLSQKIKIQPIIIYK